MKRAPASRRPSGGAPSGTPPSSAKSDAAPTAGNQQTLRALGASGKPGQPLASEVRAPLEHSLGHDFSAVRVHTDAQAAASAASLGATAYTVGTDIVFGANKYRPGTDAGQRTLAHELAHVVQQSDAPPAADAPQMGEEGSSQEGEARRAGRLAPLGRPAPVAARSPLMVQRQTSEESVQTLSDDELASEHGALQAWLLENAADPTYAERSAYFGQLEAEVLRRNPARIAAQARQRELVKFVRRDTPVQAAFGPISMFGRGEAAFFTEFGFGLMDGINEQPEVRKARLLERFEQLNSLSGNWSDKLDYGLGFGKGVALGVWGEIRGIVDLILLLPQLQIRANQWLGSQIARLSNGEELRKRGAALERRLQAAAAKAAAEIIEFFSDPAKAMQRLSDLVDELLAAGLDKAYQLGHGAVESAFQYLEKPFFELGEDMGRITGAILFQVVLLVASDAIGNLIAKGAGALARMGRFILEGAGEVLSGLRALVTELLSLLRSIGQSILRAFEGTLKALADIVEEVKAFFGDLAEAAAPRPSFAGGVGDAPPGVFMSEAAEGGAGRLPRRNPVTVDELYGRAPKRETLPPPEAEVLEPPASDLPGLGIEPAVTSLDSIEVAKAAGVPEELINEGTVITRAEYADVLPEHPPVSGRPAPVQLDPAGRTVGLSDVQNIDVAADIELLKNTKGVNPSSIRVNQTQVIGDMRVGYNRPDLYVEINGRRMYIEYDRAPGSRAMDHALRILTNDPDAIVILKIIGFD